MRSKIIAFFFLCIFFCTHAFGQEYKTDHEVDSASYYNETGLEYYNRKDYENALRYFERSLQLRLKFSGEDNAVVATMYNNIGDSYRMQKQYLQAFENHKKALQIRLRLFGENSLYVAISYNKVGAILSFLARYQEALDYYQHALEIRLRLQGENNLDVAKIYNHIGHAYKALKQYDEAIENYLYTLKIRLELLGENHKDVMSVYDDIAVSYYRHKKYAEAIVYYEKEKDVRIALYGENTQNVATLYAYLGDSYRYNNQYEQSLNSHKKALRIRKKLFGEKHLDVADSYNKVGIEHYFLGNYEESIKNYRCALDIRIALQGENNLGVAQLYENIGDSYRYHNQSAQSLECHENALRIRKNLLVEKHLDVADSYNKVGNAHYFLGNYEESVKNYRCALDIRIALQGENNLDVATIYSNIGNSFFECKNYTSAIENYEQCLRIRKELKEEYNEETSLIYIKLCSANVEMKRYEEVIKNCKNAMEIYSYLQYDDKTVAPFYSLLAVVYYSLDDFVNTVEYGEKYISLADESTNRIDILKIVGNAYHSMGKLDFALDRLEKASKNIYDKSMYSLTFQINSIKEYIETGKYKWTYEYQGEHGASKTREMLINSSKYILEKYGKYSKEYISAIDCVIETYESGEYNIESVNWQKEKLDAQIHVLGYDNISTWATYNRITSLFKYSHQIQEAMTIDSIMAESGSYRYIDDLARRHFDYGNYRTSFNIYNKYIEETYSQTTISGETLCSYFINALRSASLSLCYTEDWDSLFSFGHKWMNCNLLTVEQQYNFFRYIFRFLRPHSKEYNQAERLLEDFKRTHSDATLIVGLREDQLNLFISQDNYVGAMHVLEEILDSLDGVMKIDITREHKILQFLYGSVYEYCLMMNNNYDEALYFNDKNLVLIKEIEGYERSNEYRGWRVRRCYILDKLHQYDAMYKHVQFLLNDYYNKNNNIFLASRDFNSNIATDSPWWTTDWIENALLRCLYFKGNFQEAKKYVLNERRLSSIVTERLESSKCHDEEYERFVSVSMWTPSDTTLAKQVYDYTLAYKSAVLTSWTSLQKLILESDNNEVKEKLTEFNLLREQIQVSKERGDETSQMEEKIRTLQVQLEEDSKKYGDYARFMKLKYNDICYALDDKSVAIEFLTYPDPITDSTLIGAAIITNDVNLPIIIPLCKENELDKDNIYENTKAADMIWRPILSVLKWQKKIYFAAAGALHSISIENLPYQDGLISDYYTLHRLSSTREVIPYKRIYGKVSHIYGGINYNAILTHADVDVMIKDEGSPCRLSRDRSASLRAAVEDIPYLPGTRQEVEEIVRTISVRQDSVVSHLSDYGTETSIKKLRPNETKLLHIATHGFYEKASGNDKEQEEKVLSRSGLFMAGAQTFLDGEEIPEGVDDGILTAQEISTLDLRGLDLVTLSACETAKGDITGDGVFGLQRGFKKAGANSILMSLWKVDDEATCKLMTEFYSNWIGKKMTKHDALEAAKKTVRETKGWEDPKYWAAFILLDGLD